jgi:hypothetical protein
MADDTLSIASSATVMSSAYALQLSGGYVTVNSKHLPTDGDYTIEMWIKPVGEIKENGMGLLMWGDSSKICSINGIVIGSNGSITNTWGTKSKDCVAGGFSLLGKWNHICITKNNSKRNIYINGHKFASDRTPTGHFVKSDTGLFIGSHDDSSTFKGYITEIRIWNVCRTDKEVRHNRKRQLGNVNEDGLIGYWNSGTYGSNMAIDRSPSQTHGHIVGDGTWELIHDLPVRISVSTEPEVPESPIVDDFGWLLRSGQFSDIDVCIGTKSHKAHKAILVARSNFFRVALLEDPSVSRITIEGIHGSILEELLYFIYTEKLMTEDISKLEQLIHASEILNLVQLMELCIDVVESLISLSNVISIYQSRCSVIPSIKNMCVSFITEHLVELRNTESFRSLDAAQLQDIISNISSDSLKLESIEMKESFSAMSLHPASL